MKKAYIFLADGFEEIEGLTVVDILRRAGINAVTVSVTGNKEITGSHKIHVRADILFEESDFKDGSLFVLPGGMPGTLSLKAHAGLAEILGKAYSEGKYVAAICAAPTVLSGLGMLKDRKACAYPSFEDSLECGEVLRQPVVKDGNIITGRGMGAAIPFALELTALLTDKDKAEEIRTSIVY